MYGEKTYVRFYSSVTFLSSWAWARSENRGRAFLVLTMVLIKLQQQNVFFKILYWCNLSENSKHSSSSISLNLSTLFQLCSASPDIPPAAPQHTKHLINVACWFWNVILDREVSFCICIFTLIIGFTDIMQYYSREEALSLHRHLYSFTVNKMPDSIQSGTFWYISQFTYAPVSGC